jgi:acetyl-CoA carboxylase carboxyltransferase component
MTPQSRRDVRSRLYAKASQVGTATLLVAIALSGCTNDEPRLNATERAEIELAFRAYVDARNASAVTSDMLCRSAGGAVSLSVTTAGTTLVVDNVTDITLTGDSALIQADTHVLSKREVGPFVSAGSRNWPMSKEGGQWKYCPPVWGRGTGSPRP